MLASRASLQEQQVAICGAILRMVRLHSSLRFPIIVESKRLAFCIMVTTFLVAS